MKHGKQTKSYSHIIRTFAITLHFYSPRAYSYVRSVFDNNLPSISTIRNWYSSINGGPGFSEEAFAILREKANKANSNGNEVLVCLIFDEISIRKHLQWDRTKNKTVGYITYGTGSEEECEDDIPIAKDALVFMVTGVNEKFKLPIGYVFINGLKAGEKAALVQEALLLLNRSGVKTIGMTFDGLRTNLSMCKELDASFDDKNPFIINPHSCDEIYALLDACHMIKLVRNALARHKVLFFNNQQIKWEFILQLYEYQKKHGTNLGNKITKKHVQWDRHKMNVRIATETLSGSVADSLQLLLSSGVKEFQGCEETINFIRNFNDLFDVMNSKNDDATMFKKPISIHSSEPVFALFDKIIEYIKNIKLKHDGKSILETKSKTGFAGFVQDMMNFKLIFHKYVENGVLIQIYTYRFSQDHLETLFACIRAMFGCNDNPTTQQFESAFRKLIGMNQITASKHANCANSEINMLTVSSRKTNQIALPHNLVINEFDDDVASLTVDGSSDQKASPQNFVINESDDDVASLAEDDSSDQIIDHILALDASTIEQEIIAKSNLTPLICNECLETFSENVLVEDSYVSLIAERKMILVPCLSTVQICESADKAMKIFKNDSNRYDEIFQSALNSLDIDKLYCSSNFEDRCSKTHKIGLVHTVIEFFLRKRFENINKSKTLNIHKDLVRSHCKKLIHYMNQ